MFEFISHRDLLINADFITLLKEHNLADFRNLMDFQGGTHVKKAQQRSLVKIDLGNRRFYLKRHSLPPLGQVLSALSWPRKEDARNEWENIKLLHNLGFNTMVPVAFGEIRRFGLLRQSLTLTKGIDNAEKLETFLPSHYTPPLDRLQIDEKRALIRQVGLFARDFHSKGLNHQDFYLGHIFIRPSDSRLFIIDLQRVHRAQRISTHDLIKDLAQICYSAGRTGVITRSDRLRFILSYLGKEALSAEDKRLIRKILSKTAKIAKHDAKIQLRKKAAQ